jgi:hypothetical protein
VYPTLDDAPTAEDISAITDPFARVVKVTAIARRCGTLTRELSELRKSDLAKLRTTHSVGVIALRVGLSQPRISQLTATTPEEQS